MTGGNVTETAVIYSNGSQECERMNTLIFTIRTTLEDLDAGMKGQLNITENMEKLAQSLFVN